MKDQLDQIAIKQTLIEQCEEFVQQKIDVSEKLMNEAQDSANNETKSSAGDKFETGRAMMHAERDKNYLSPSSGLPPGRGIF